MNDIAELMRKHDAYLIFRNYQLYFDDGEWVICYRENSTTKWYILDRYLDAVPNSLSEVLKFLESTSEE